VNGLPVARLFGFEIRIHLSWALILAIIAVTVATQVGRVDPESSAAVRWLVGGVVAGVFLLSAIAHELGHAVAARRAGMPGGPVVVYFFGGAASPRTTATRPRDEIVTALAGPLVSIVLGVLLLVPTVVGEVVGGGPVQVVGRISFLVGGMNILLGLANLIPAYPLDGGRVARGIAWGRRGDSQRGLRTALRVGRWVGMLMGVIGIVVILLLDAIDGLMLALAGWFFVSTNRALERGVDFDRVIEGLNVADVMDRDVATVPPGLSVDTFAMQVLDGTSSPSLPVVDDGRLVGVIGLTQLRRLRPDRWAQTRTGDVMVGEAALPDVGPETSLRTVLDELGRSGLDGLPVLEAGRLAGIVTRDAVARAIQERLHPSATPS
jgi:Zn-dependent protease/predicted transcriptional regulator